jgi:hypothetical protein
LLAPLTLFDTWLSPAVEQDRALLLPLEDFPTGFFLGVRPRDALEATCEFGAREFALDGTREDALEGAREAVCDVAQDVN